MESPFGVEHGYEISKALTPGVERGLLAVTRKTGNTISGATPFGAKARYAAARLGRSTTNGRASKVVEGGHYAPATLGRGEGKWSKLSEQNALSLANRKKPGRFLP